MTAPILKHAVDLNRLTAISTKPRHTQTPSSAIEHVENAGTQRHQTTAQDPSSRPGEQNWRLTAVPARRPESFVT